MFGIYSIIKDYYINNELYALDTNFITRKRNEKKRDKNIK